MTTRTFHPYDPEELWLLPPAPQDWLPEDHLAYVLTDLVEALNHEPILATYGGVTRGTVPYHPQLLVKVLLYAYAVGIPANMLTLWRTLAHRPRGPGHRLRTLSGSRKVNRRGQR